MAGALASISVEEGDDPQCENANQNGKANGKGLENCGDEGSILQTTSSTTSSTTSTSASPIATISGQPSGISREIITNITVAGTDVATYDYS